jgi:hypothetical protein
MPNIIMSINLIRIINHMSGLVKLGGKGLSKLLEGLGKAHAEPQRPQRNLSSPVWSLSRSAIFAALRELLPSGCRIFEEFW